ncbi:TPA: hypothetical protein HA297_06715 [Candidatus Woesearchaeota archaeon]|nr:hypothetical protein [Candidatus Woesearchaeota archaeon]
MTRLLGPTTGQSGEDRDGFPLPNEKDEPDEVLLFPSKQEKQVSASEPREHFRLPIGYFCLHAEQGR